MSEEIEIGLDWDEQYPVFLLVTDPEDYRMRNITVPRELVERYQAAQAEWEAVQALLHEFEQQTRASLDSNMGIDPKERP
jgi:hypothetical protein